MIPDFLLLRLRAWALRKIASRAPDTIIAPRGVLYLRRWQVIPRNRLFNIYLHEYHGSDTARAPHDHPWVNVSIPITGGIGEMRYDFPGGPFRDYIDLIPGKVYFRRPSTPHRIFCWQTSPQRPLTLFLTGPMVRTWGFWCQDGWRPYNEVTDRTPGTSTTTSTTKPTDC